MLTRSRNALDSARRTLAPFVAAARDPVARPKESWLCVVESFFATAFFAGALAAGFFAGLQGQRARIRGDVRLLGFWRRRGRGIVVRAKVLPTSARSGAPYVLTETALPLPLLLAGAFLPLPLTLDAFESSESLELCMAAALPLPLDDLTG